MTGGEGEHPPLKLALSPPLGAQVIAGLPASQRLLLVALAVAIEEGA